MFYSTRDPEQLQSIINEELGKVLKFCAASMLSIDFKKTNYMIITSPKKKTNIRITVCKYYRAKVPDQILRIGLFSPFLQAPFDKSSQIYIYIYIYIVYHTHPMLDILFIVYNIKHNANEE